MSGREWLGALIRLPGARVDSEASTPSASTLFLQKVVEGLRC